MRKLFIQLVLTAVLMTGAGVAMACDYKKGETKFADYAKCRYGEDSVLVVDLPENSAWHQCVYFSEAFRPEKLLAVTKDVDGQEMLSLNDRSQIGNPCYLTKQQCDAALKTFKAAGY